MIDDIYLSLSMELYEKGSWDKDTFIKRVKLYAKEKNMNMNAIDSFIKRVTKTHEYTIQDKRKFLAVVTLDGEELKYGDIANLMSDEQIEQFFGVEEERLGKEQIDKFFQQEDIKKEVEKDKVNEEHRQIVKVVKKSASKNVQERKNEETKIIGNLTLTDIKNGNFVKDDLRGKTAHEYISKLNKLVDAVDKDSFSQVYDALKKNISETYAKMFEEEWNEKQFYKQENEESVQITNTVVVPPLIFDEPKTNSSNVENIVAEPVKEELDNMPETEEEFEVQTENITKVESDSNVKNVEVSNERLNKLKKGKGKVINYFLKSAITISALLLIHPLESIPLIGGYLYFASEIKNGRFSPEKPVGKAIKKVVETIMNIGISKDELENERGKSR